MHRAPPPSDASAMPSACTCALIAVAVTSVVLILALGATVAVEEAYRHSTSDRGGQEFE